MRSDSYLFMYYLNDIWQQQILKIEMPQKTILCNGTYIWFTIALDNGLALNGRQAIIKIMMTYWF